MGVGVGETTSPWLRKTVFAGVFLKGEIPTLWIRFCFCLSDRLVVYDGYPYSMPGKWIQIFLGGGKVSESPHPFPALPLQWLIPRGRSQVEI